MSKTRTYTYLTLGYCKDGRKVPLTQGELVRGSRKETYVDSRALPELTDAIQQAADAGESFVKVMTFTRRKAGDENPDLAKVVLEAPVAVAIIPAVDEPADELAEEPAAVAQESVSAAPAKRGRNRR